MLFVSRKREGLATQGEREVSKKRMLCQNKRLNSLYFHSERAKNLFFVISPNSSPRLKNDTFGVARKQVIKDVAFYDAGRKQVIEDVAFYDAGWKHPHRIRHSP